MAFPIIAIRTPEDNGDGNYPDVTTPDDPQPVHLEPADGTAPTRVRAQRIAVYHHTGSDLLPLIPPADLELDVIITDTRLIVASRKFDQGRTWGGLGPAGVVGAGALTVISKARAAQRRRGKTLAGHLRYPWISAIAVNQRTDRRHGQPVLRLQITDDTNRHLILELVFPPGTNLAELAHHLTYRVAHHRLTTHGQLSPGDRAGLEAVLRAGPLTPQGNSFASIGLPAGQPVGPHAGPPAVLPAGASTPIPAYAAMTSNAPGTGNGPAEPAQLRRCIRTGCTDYGTATTSSRCPNCGTATQRIHG